jgi:hypothetical protein
MEDAFVTITPEISTDGRTLNHAEGDRIKIRDAALMQAFLHSR